MATFIYTPAVSSQRIGDTLAALNTNFSGILTQFNNVALGLSGMVVLSGLQVTLGTFPNVAVASGTALASDGTYQTITAIPTLLLPATANTVTYVYMDNTGTIVQGATLPVFGVPLGILTNNAGGTAATLLDLRPILTSSLGSIQRSINSSSAAVSLTQRQTGATALEIRNAAGTQTLSLHDNGNVVTSGVFTGNGSGLTNLPSLVTSHTFVVASQAAMLALSATMGDIAVRTDVSETFILSGSDPTQLSNWTELLSPTAPVSSFNGRTGAITLLLADVTGALTFTPANKAGDTFTGTVQVPRLGLADPNNLTAGMVSNLQVVSGTSYLTYNCYYDSVGLAWNRLDITKPYAAEGLDSNGNRLFFGGPSGANPIGTLQSRDLLTEYFTTNWGGVTGLTYAYNKGTVVQDNIVTQVAAGTIALTASATNYFEIDPGTGTVYLNTAGFNVGHFPIAAITTNTTGIIPNGVVPARTSFIKFTTLPGDLRCTAGAALTLNYTAGMVNLAGIPTSFAASNITLTNTATNYVYVSALGVVSLNTTGWVKNTTAIPLAQVVCAGGVITSVTDKRAFLSLGGGGGGGYSDWVDITATLSGSNYTLPGTGLAPQVLRGKVPTMRTVEWVQNGTGVNSTITFQAGYLPSSTESVWAQCSL